MANIKLEEVHWEKLGIYFAMLAGFLTCIFYITDMKERIAKLEGAQEERNHWESLEGIKK